tara:strand:- start:735 stop:866 length:132 start_codon:yes stop_codon:yes gene_type:complete
MYRVRNGTYYYYYYYCYYCKGDVRVGVAVDLALEGHWYALELA